MRCLACIAIASQYKYSTFVAIIMIIALADKLMGEGAERLCHCDSKSDS